MKQKINHWFATYRGDYSMDDMVLAAENCAIELGHDEWLDDSDHIVWEIALKWFE